ncbi:maintenance of telomere capping protein 1 [Myxozyma melibiosi]|uniref:Maintenance of telomere capping protein 1 n=1 Tax=Myxozyma melibiosi TaxID=54550 RepID=A0ABR1FEQ5_9ASCO
MASTPTKQQDDEDVLELLESLGPDARSSSSGNETPSTTEPSEKDLLGFLDSLEKETALPVSESESKDAASTNEKASAPVAQKAAAPAPTEAAAAAPAAAATASAADPESESAAASLPNPVASITSWFGSSGLWDSASAAVKGAEAKVRDLQQAAETQSWEDKVKGNITALNKFGISKTLVSTLSSVLHTIAPPIMRHEQLRIHIFHDLVGYPSIDTIVYSVFDRVMQQVEGGELMIVQKGRESRHRDSDKKGVKRDMGMFHGGLVAGEKLCKANIQQIRAKGKEVETSPEEESPVRKSDIYLSIQACVVQDSSSDATKEKVFVFIIHLDDPFHSLAFTTHSQSFPLQWCEWLDSDEPIPGQVDPREWLAEWVEEGLGLAVGVVAQRYVASRMAIGVDVSEAFEEEEKPAA